MPIARVAQAADQRLVPGSRPITASRSPTTIKAKRRLMLLPYPLDAKIDVDVRAVRLRSARTIEWVKQNVRCDYRS